MGNPLARHAGTVFAPAMQLVAYLRVSTANQAEHGQGLDVQHQAVRAWARERGHRIVATYRDEGQSGSNGIEHREALAEALRALRGAKAGGLVVYRLDRLARDLVLQEQLLAEVWGLGAEVFSTASGESDLRDDPADPSRRMIRQVLGAVAEYERAMIALRLRAGREAKRAQGGYAGHGSPPYGYRSENGVLVPDPAQQAVIERMRTMHEAGHSLRSIAGTLNREGVPAKRPGSQWHARTVGRVLHRRP